MTQPAPIVAHDWQVDAYHPDVFVRVVELLPSLFLRTHLSLSKGRYESPKLSLTLMNASGKDFRPGRTHKLRDYEVDRYLTELRALGVTP